MLSGSFEALENFLADLTLDYPNLSEVIPQKRSASGDTAFFETVRRIALYTTDSLWVEHLETMEYTRSSVNLRAYGQREPLIEYKKEGLRLFKEMEALFREQVASLIGTMNIDPSNTSVEVTEERPSLILSSTDSTGNVPGTPKGEPKIGRNDPCHCGSGKKYKNCHGKDK